MQKISKLIMVAISILILVGISPYLFQKINAQPLNLTAQQNLTQSQLAGQFRCNISPDQPSDPVELYTAGRSYSGDPFPNMQVYHTVEEVFKCASPVSSIPPPYNRDISISIAMEADWYTSTFQKKPIYYVNTCDRNLEGNVSSCKWRYYENINNTATGCREIPIQHSLEMSTAISSTASGGEYHIPITSKTYIYNCDQAGDRDKIKVVTVFSYIGPTHPLVATCIIDAATATVDSCSAELLGINSRPPPFLSTPPPFLSAPPPMQ